MLNAFYKKEYYGSRDKKFISIIERATNFFNFERARKINIQVNNAKEPSERRVLDIGCGRANLLQSLSGLGYECHGIERSDYEFPSNLEDIFFYNKPLETIQFKPELFDVVIMWHSLEHMSNPAEIIKEIYRIIKPNGLLVIAVPNFESIQRNLFRSKWFHLDLPRHTHHFGKKALINYLELNGFRVKYITTFSLEQSLYGFIQSLFNIFPWIPPNRLYSLIKERNSPGISMELIFWIGLSCLIFPLSLFEYVVSGLLGCGACINLFAYKE
jgi:2-polyprenyl-3-methyl-5-hydroxy-6-metoxy-1,4-benzoquinol methylase